MAIANKTSVLSHFNNEVAEHYGQKAKFYTDQKAFKVDVSYDKKYQLTPLNIPLVIIHCSSI